MNHQLCTDLEEFYGEGMLFWVGWEEQCIKVTRPLLLEKYDIIVVSFIPSLLSYLSKELKNHLSMREKMNKKCTR